jgi:formamidopyrimidine-DNA glycosylase
VIERGIELGGATIDNYKQVDGFSGKYQDAVLTYGREGKPCFNCGTSIQKMKLGGRGTYFCPECQE